MLLSALLKDSFLECDFNGDIEITGICSSSRDIKEGDILEYETYFCS